jgi:2'-phosphotransferase
MTEETQTASTSSAAVIADASSAPKAKPAKKTPHPRSPAAQSPSVQLSKALSYFLRHGALKESLPITPDGYIYVPLLLAKPRIRQIDMAPENEDFTKDGKKKLKRVTVEDIREAVKGKAGEKKRFELKEEGDEVFVRAVQGHSLESVTELDHVVLNFSNLQVLDLREGEQRTQAPTEDKKLSETEVKAGSGKSIDGLPLGVEILHGTTPDAWEKIKASGGLSKMKRNHIHLARGRPGVPGVGSGESEQ